MCVLTSHQKLIPMPLVAALSSEQHIHLFVGGDAVIYWNQGYICSVMKAIYKGLDVKTPELKGLHLGLQKD